MKVKRKKKKKKKNKAKTLSDVIARGWAVTVEVATNCYGTQQSWTASGTAAGSICPRSVEIPAQKSYGDLVAELYRAVTTAGVHDAEWGEKRLTQEIHDRYNSMIQLIEERARKRHNLDILWKSR
jgi:hypothetical protein